ncbi:unnamed protein product [Acanthosepion pharaonis]|uniref:Uncharacterized protein n=1 Tax=Acanthosepion pharaonis TaxID=158019 RepID=A0A812DEW4_ACAPH|nr:unnamed protein product [Sepia pharaonis]
MQLQTLQEDKVLSFAATLIQDTGSNGQKLSETNNDRLMRGHSSSFGLHSPDQLPCEMLQAVCNSECESSLCLDLDIIDLTLIPPIEVVDEEIRRGLCSSGTSAPPPGFSDDEVEDSAHRRQCKNHHYHHHHHHHHHQQKLIQPVSLGPDEASVKLLSSPSSGKTQSL